MFPLHDITGVAVALGGNCPGGSCPKWQLSWVAIVLGGSCPTWQLSGLQLSGWQLSWVAIVLGGSCPRWQLSLVAVVLGGSCPM